MRRNIEWSPISPLEQLLKGVVLWDRRWVLVLWAVNSSRALPWWESAAPGRSRSLTWTGALGDLFGSRVTTTNFPLFFHLNQKTMAARLVKLESSSFENHQKSIRKHLHPQSEQRKDLQVLRIEISNLNRQFLFRQKDVGSSKSQAAAQAAKAMNPEIQIVAGLWRVSQSFLVLFSYIPW